MYDEFQGECQMLEMQAKLTKLCMLRVKSTICYTLKPYSTVKKGNVKDSLNCTSHTLPSRKIISLYTLP